MSKIEVRPAGAKGRGVFATEPIEAGEIVTADPVVELDPYEIGAIEQTVLTHYWWNWSNKGPLAHTGAIVFGPASMMNNERHPNATFERDIEGARLIIRAARTIRPGDEITVDYDKA